jgi:multidrug resistance efflux pump
MKKVNWFYITLILLIPVLLWLLRPDDQMEIAFFGFAENLETEINYNYDVMVEKILVSPGQRVEEGAPLLKISRRKSKEVLDDQLFQIKTLRAEETAWKEKKKNELKSLELEKENDLAIYQEKIGQLEKKIAFKRSLIDQSEQESAENGQYKPLSTELDLLKKEMQREEMAFDQEIQALQNEINLGINPYRTKISELEAERAFDQSHKVQFIDVVAPSGGLIGNIFCKEAEHVPAFKTLLTFYEPHSGIIKGYVHEDLTMSVHVADIFLVSSLKDENIAYEGKVIGLGSRIVEIPARLRKFPQVKSYGREITLEIPKDNIFLQKEKVSVKIHPDYPHSPELN